VREPPHGLVRVRDHRRVQLEWRRDLALVSDTPATVIYTLSLHDALPIWRGSGARSAHPGRCHPPDAARRCRFVQRWLRRLRGGGDRKSTRLNSSHVEISYAVFCLKKKIRPTPRDRSHRALRPPP